MENPIEIRFFGKKAGPLLLSPALPSMYEPENIAGIKRLEARGSFGHILLQQIMGNGFSVWHHNYFLHQDDTLLITWDIPVLRLWLSLRNSFYYTRIDDPEMDDAEHVLHERGFNIDYAPLPQREIRVSGKQIYTYVEIHLSTDLFADWISYFAGVENFLHRVKKAQAVCLNENNSIAGSELLTLVDDILYCSYAAVIRRKYHAQKVMELLFLALDQMTRSPAHRSDLLPEAVVTRIYVAREIITANLDRRYSLHELGAMAGLSPYHLKKGFKAIFDLSVNNFLHEERMQKARLLLEETDLPISRIAANVGYTHPFAFSSAFRDFFGYTPSLVQKSRRIRTD